MSKGASSRKSPKALAKEAEILDRQVRALELRIEGRSVREIAKALGIGHTQAAEDVRSALTDLGALKKQRAEEVLALELERLDIAVAAMIPSARKGNPMAVDRIISLSKRRGELVKIEVPKESKISGQIDTTPGPETAARLADLISLAMSRKAEGVEEPGGLPS